LMLLVGIVSVFRQARRFVDFSLWKLFGYPTLALILGGVAGLLVSTQLDSVGLWLFLGVKAVVVAVSYSAVLLIFEHAEYRRNISMILNLLGRDRWQVLQN
jgi:chromate transport protein ChrA